MKKTVLAMAVLAAASSAAFAQSSVTLYGVLDASIENVKGDDSVTRVTSDNYASSRLGFRGVEDLGGGLKGKFVLESGLGVDTGNGGSGGKFWSRSAWLGVEGGFGELRLGRQDSAIGVLAGNTNLLGAQAYDDFNIANTFAGDSSFYRRVDNAITYLLPTVAAGLTGQLQYSTRVNGDEVADSDIGEAWGFNLQYAAGPFGVGVGYIDATTDADGDEDDKGVLVYGYYDFGAAKVTAYWNQDDRSTEDEKRKLYGLRVGVPFGNAFVLQAGVSKVQNAEFNEDADATIVALKGVYNLSKRTALYGLITHVSNDDGSNLGIVATPAGENSRGIAIGVRHTF